MFKEKKETKNNMKNSKIQINKKIMLITFAVLVCIIAIIFIAINLKNKQEQLCSVQFNTNGGIEIDAIYVKYGDAVDEPENPVKSGFDFLGWYLNGKKYNFNAKVYNNIILEAKWQAKENVEIVVISFDTDGGSKQDDIEIEKGTYLVKPIDPIKKGYTFEGWYLDDEKFLFVSNTIDKNITLKAKWNKVKETTKNDKHDNTVNANSSNNVFMDENNKESINNVFHEYDDLVTAYSGQWYLSGYEDAYCILERKEYYDTAYMRVTCVNVDVNLKEAKYINLHTFDIKYNEWDKDLKKNKVKLNSSSITINGLKFVRNKGTKSRYDNTYYRESLGTWYMYNKPDSQLVIRISSVGYTGIQESINYNGVCIKKVSIMNSTSESCGDVRNNKIYNDMGIKIEDGILYMNINNEMVKFYKTPTVINVSSIELNKSMTDLNVGDSTSIIATINPFEAYNKKVTWSSNNPSVATVNNNGTVIAIGPGIATITATSQDGNKTDSCDIRVKTVNVTGVMLNKSSINLIKGNTENLIPTISPINATNKNLIWSSSNPSVATVNNNGNITAIRKGTTTITVTTNDGGYVANCIVNVSNPTLSSSGSIGIQTTVSSIGAIRGVCAEVTTSGGTGIYTYNINLYRDGTLIGSTTNASSNKLFISGYTNGNYTMEYEVRDSEGMIKTGTVSSKISGF